MPALTTALTITARDPGSRARAGVLRTAHGEVRTPHFVPLATKATVKGLLPAEVAALGYDIVLGNTYHLFLDPGHELIDRQPVIVVAVADTDRPLRPRDCIDPRCDAGE